MLANLSLKYFSNRSLFHTLYWCSRSQLQQNYHKITYSTRTVTSVFSQRNRNIHTSHQSLFHEDNQTKSLSVIDNVKQVKNSPIAALSLGFSGILPIIAAPIYMISSGEYLPYIDMAQLTYSACILSFIGGVRWGLTMPEGSTQGPDWHNLGYSIVAPLVAWAGLLANATVGSVVIIGGLAFTGYMDIAMWGYPNWYKGIRFCLTFIAIIALWTSLMCKYILGQKNSIAAETSEN